MAEPKAKKQQVTYSEVHRYLSHSSSAKFEEECSEIRRRTIRRFSSNIILEDGLLFHVQGAEGTKRRWIYEKEQQKQIIMSIHDNPAGGCHFGRDKTRDKVTSKYYWHNQYEDIDNYVKVCEACQKVSIFK